MLPPSPSLSLLVSPTGKGGRVAGAMQVRCENTGNATSCWHGMALPIRFACGRAGLHVLTASRGLMKRGTLSVPPSRGRPFRAVGMGAFIVIDNEVQGVGMVAEGQQANAKSPFVSAT